MPHNSGNQFHNISQIEASLWEAADQLRANSKLSSSEYCMPVLGVIFLRHASNRYAKALTEIQAAQAAGKMPQRPLVPGDFIKRRSLMLPREATYEYLLSLQDDVHLGKALVDAMTAIENGFEPLLGQLPKDYERFENDILDDLLRTFDNEELRTTNGDVFGRIYEYFLMKFAMQGAQDNGEFFTPPSLVQTIVNVIEPDHGIVFDPACGSGGMFVQSSHFIEDHGEETGHKVTFYGQEKTATTIRLAKMNLAVHGLEGDIREANTFYDDVHPIWGECDFVMANPPFNVDLVDAEKVKGDRRLPFGLPGVSKGNGKKKEGDTRKNKETVSNGNYLWISYFHSYLGPKGRAGFVMSSQASSAGHAEAEVRRKLVETGDVDVMISIRPNFFYTRTVPCELWHFDKGKPEERRDQVLMLDARNIYRKVTRKIYDFSPEQLANLTAIVWLYRGESERFVDLVAQHINSSIKAANDCFLSEDIVEKPCEPLDDFLHAMDELKTRIMPFVDAIGEGAPHDAIISDYLDADNQPGGPVENFRIFTNDTGKSWTRCNHNLTNFRDCLDHHIAPLAEQSRALASTIDLHYKTAVRLIDLCEKDLDARESTLWNSRDITKARKAADAARHVAVEHLKRVRYFKKQAAWLVERFPNAEFVAVPGLCRIVTKADIKAADWSLTPGRYVGIAPAEVDEDFDFEQALRDIHVELADLNREAVELAGTIQVNFEGMV